MFYDSFGSIIFQADTVQLKAFLSTIKMIVDGKKLDKTALSSLAPASSKAVDRLKTRMSIKTKSEYPITKGFSSSLEYLQITNCHLRKFDSRILEIRNLKSLDLSHNSIQTIPSSFDRIPCLSELILHDNNITDIPTDFCKSTARHSLTLLDVSNNQLKMLRPSISQFTGLLTLKLQNNCLIKLSSGLGSLCNLRHLHVNNNKLKTLPVGFSQLRLDTLDLYDNEFLDDGPSTVKDHLIPVLSLKETAARFVKRHRYAKTNFLLVWNYKRPQLFIQHFRLLSSSL